jgi:hypothetical protein
VCLNPETLLNMSTDITIKWTIAEWDSTCWFCTATALTSISVHSWSSRISLRRLAARSFW